MTTVGMPQSVVLMLQWGLTREGEEGSPNRLDEPPRYERFNGASPVRVRKGRAGDSTFAVHRGFNGASPVRVRKEKNRSFNHLRNDRASMGPHP